jgi:hypothetical protein
MDITFSAFTKWLYGRKDRVIFRNKSMRITKNRIIINIVIWLAFNVFLYFLFSYYQPFCEPCLSNDCPPCLSEQQYIIIYFCLGFNVIYFLYLIFWKKKK